MASSITKTTTKTELRRLMQRKVSEMKPSERQVESWVILHRLINNPKYASAKRVAIYLSTAYEVVTISILRRIFETNKQCFIPYIDNEESPRMSMVELKSMAEYAQMPHNCWYIKEPTKEFLVNREKAVPELGNLDIIIVPGLAFSNDGRRLGKGKGYYDEFLFHWSKHAPKPLYSLGLAFKEQIVDDPLSVEGEDYVLDEVLTA